MTSDIIVVVVPAFDPPPGLVPLVREMLATGVQEVVVVDDGSGPGHRSTFEELARRPDVTVLRHDTNRGKGAALRTATELLIARPDVVGMVTADADGQHTPTDVWAVVGRLRQLLRRPGEAAVLGSRDFGAPGIPRRSKLGNRITTAVVGALYGRSLPDTQTGLRGFSREVFGDLLAVPGDRYQYEMRVLLRLLRRRMHIDEVPIATVYTADNSTSHFRPIRDSAIIYGAILREGGAFALTSLMGAAVDIGVFALVMDVAFGGVPTPTSVLVAAVVARVLSTVANYTANRHLVFGSTRPVTRSGSRYYALAVGLLGASWALTTVMAQALDGHVVWAKILVDSSLFVVSYLVQKRWVFDR